MSKKYSTQTQLFHTVHKLLKWFWLEVHEPANLRYDLFHRRVYVDPNQGRPKHGADRPAQIQTKCTVPRRTTVRFKCWHIPEFCFFIWLNVQYYTDLVHRLSTQLSTVKTHRQSVFSHSLVQQVQLEKI